MWHAMVTYVYCSLMLILVNKRMSEVYYAANGQLLHDDIIRPVISAYTHTFLLDKSGICYWNLQLLNNVIINQN
jgi:hypothetical protein